MVAIKKYFMLLKPYILIECIICVLGLLSSVISLINPMLLQILIDNVIVQKQISILKYIFAIFIIFFILSNMLSYANGYLGTYINQAIQKNLRLKVFSHVENAKLSEKLNMASGDFITKINDDTAAIASYVMGTFISVISYVTNILTTAVLLYIYNKELAYVIFGVTFIQILISLKFSNVVRDNQRKIKYKYSMNMNFLNLFFSGFKSIKAYNREQDMKERYEEIQDDLISLNFRGYHITFAYQTIIAFVSFVGSCLVYGLGIYYIFQGNMSLGTLFVFDIVAERFVAFASGIVNFNVELQTVLVSVERIDSLFEMEGESEGSMNNDNSDVVADDIVLDDVDFSYESQKVLNGINYHFEKGKKYAIIGKSGCGKSTLINILLKFYDPDKGTVKFGKQDISSLAPNTVRNNIVAVFQDSILNEGTIEENIRYGNKDASIDDIISAAKICHINDFIEELENGYQTNIGEIGDKISGGQKQRLCIARALIRKAEIYIFDEAFCNMDKNLEYEVFNDILKCLSNKMIIVISHNINLISKMENILVIDNGEIEASGNHDYLINNSDTYMSLYKRGDTIYE